MARLSWLRLSWTPALLSKPTISSVCSPAHFSLFASSLKYCHVRSWFSPSAANDPDRGSISATLMVSAWATPVARLVANAKAPSLNCVAYLIASPILVIQPRWLVVHPKLPANPCALAGHRADRLVLLQTQSSRGPLHRPAGKYRGRSPASAPPAGRRRRVDAVFPDSSPLVQRSGAPGLPWAHRS